MCSSKISLAQAPQAFKYQAIARNTAGDLLQNQNITIKVSILKNSINGTAVYVETHNTSTNNFGLFTIEIGNGNIQSGNFNEIDWAAANFFVKIEIDVMGGSNYIHIGTSQLLSVPYALYSEKSGGIKVDSTTACNSNTEGNIRYNKITKQLQFCDGAQWVNLASSTNSGQADTNSYRRLTQEFAIVSEEVYDIFLRAVIEDNGANKSNDPCITANITPPIGYPKTLTLNFGTTPCLCQDGKYRSGKITVVLSGPIRNDGSGATITFNNYKVDTLTISGSMNVQNAGNIGNTILAVTITNMQFTSPSGTMTLNANLNFEWTAGKTTINTINDDVFSITGNFSGTSFKGKTFTAIITSALELKASCFEIVAGKIKIQPNGMNDIFIDFGNGSCDGVAEMTTQISVTVLGQTYYYPYTTTITLP